MLTACDDSHDSTAGIEGTGGPSIAAGTVSGFGSIYVNGIRFTTDQAEIIVDGDNTATEDDLQAGMVVYIEGDIDEANTNGTAQRVIYEPLVRGSVEVITTLDANHKQLTVLGQTLRVPDDIVFEGVSFDALSNQHFIEVSGFRADDYLLATRVELLTNTEPKRVSGPISHLNKGIQTFKINDLTITFEQATLVEDIALAEDLVVTVSGDRSPDNVFTASHIALSASGVLLGEGQRVTLEGVATDIVSGASPSFVLNGIQVNAKNAVVEQGNINMLNSGMRVKVVGVSEFEGALEAESVHIILPNDIRMSGTLEDINSETGEIRLLGVSFAVDTLTAYEDRSPQPNRRINLRNLSPGDQVEVFGYTTGDDRVVATRIKRLNRPLAEDFVNGVISTIDQNVIVIRGIEIDVSAIDTTLLATLEPGNTVRVTGQYSGLNTLAAASLTLISGQGPGGPPIPISSD